MLKLPHQLVKDFIPMVNLTYICIFLKQWISLPISTYPLWNSIHRCCLLQPVHPLTLVFAQSLCFKVHNYPQPFSLSPHASQKCTSLSSYRLPSLEISFSMPWYLCSNTIFWHLLMINAFCKVKLSILESSVVSSKPSLLQRIINIIYCITTLALWFITCLNVGKSILDNHSTTPILGFLA